MTYEPRDRSFRFPSLEDPQEFRVLTIHPGPQDAVIECTLSYTSLAIVPSPYEALSCTWSQASPDWMIVVNDCPFGVTENIVAALRALRYQSKTRLIWMEAICVNPNDLNERSRQLQLKTPIFKRAACVIVWLGSGSIKTHETFRFMERHLEWSIAPDNPKADWDDAYGHAILQNLCEDILQRRWWRWAPAVQEVTVSDKVILKCGSGSVPWTDFMDLLKWLRWRNLEANRLLSHKTLESIDAMKTMDGTDTRQPLSQLLLRTVLFDASDGLEKVFAAVGVYDRGAGQHLHLLDYTRSLLDVHLDVAGSCIKNDQSLDFLSMAGLGDSKAFDTSWLPNLQQPQPRWWTTGILAKPSYSSLIAPTATSPLAPFTAAGQTSPNAKAVSAGGKPVLAVAGIIVDSIEIVPVSSLGRSTPSLLKTWEIVLSYAFGTLEPFQSLTDRWVARMSPRILNPGTKKAKYVECLVDGNLEHCELRQELFRKARDKLLKGVPNYNLRRTRPHYPNSDDFQNAYYRTVLTDRTASQDRATAGYIAACMTDFETTERAAVLLPSGVLPHVPVENRLTAFKDDFITAVDTSLQFRTLFVTQTGYIGLGPLTMQPNDTVCVLLGCSVPVVIRREAPNRHILIGECYLHGIMDGEALGTGWDKDLQEFHLH